MGSGLEHGRWCSSVASCTMSASGAWTGSRVRIRLLSILQNDSTGAPERSEPKLGNAWEQRPLRKAATDKTSAALNHTLAAATVHSHLVHRPPLLDPGRSSSRPAPICVRISAAGSVIGPVCKRPSELFDGISGGRDADGAARWSNMGTALKNSRPDAAGALSVVTGPSL